MFNDDGEWIEKSVSLWHAWKDKVGIRHIPTYLKGGVAQSIYSTVSKVEPLFKVGDMEGLIHAVAHNGLYCFCQDVLNEHEFPYAHELIGDEHSTPYLSRQGHIAALRVSYKKRSGFLIPGSTWKWDRVPTREFIQKLAHLFQVFGFESTTPASLSEKVLRATLPEKLFISRPSVWLRRDILDNHTGGRIDLAIPAFYKKVFEYDKVKAYPSHSRRVPTPFMAPVMRCYPTLAECMGYATGWWNCTLVAHTCQASIHPIQVDGKHPVEGEVITKWLWSGELQDCLEAGYTLIEIKRGYGWTEMSDWMCPWVDILWEKYQQCQDDYLKEIIKSMMVGLPGRFLRQPENYELVPLSEQKEGDLPLLMHWKELGDRHFADYVIRIIPDKESTALSYIGSYIVAEMRRELYHAMQRAIRAKLTVIRSYIDCFSVSSDESDWDSPVSIGTGLGQWKEKIYTEVYAENNRFVGQGEIEREMKAPGLGPEQRLQLWHKYQKIVDAQNL